MRLSDQAIEYLSHCNRSPWRRVPPQIVNIPDIPETEPVGIMEAIQAQVERLRAHEPIVEPIVYIHPHIRYERRA